MSDSVRIDIHATDNASKVFGAVGGAAAKMGNQLDDVGDAFTALTKDYGMTEDAARELLASQGMVVSSLDKVDTAARDAARGVEQLEKETEQLEPALREAGTAAETTGRSLRDMGSEVRDIGLGLGVLGAAVALSGQSFRDQEIAVNTLRRTYGDATDDMLAFAEGIQDSTNFSNDAMLQSANTAATLARNYGFTFQEIQQVLQISADLAAATGFSLEDATQRVVAALRGEAEAAEQLGLTMNQAAIDSENLTLSMSNQEAGHFRLNALVEQSAFAMGAAAEQADTTYGAMSELRDTVQDAAQSFGEFIGPLGEVGAFMADNAIQFAAAGIALTQLSKAVIATRTALMGLTGATTTVAALGAALGPIGLVATVGLAVAALYEFEGNLNETYYSAIKQAEQGTKDLDEAVAHLFATGNTLAFLGERGQELFPGIQEDIANMRILEGQISTLQAQGGPQNDEQRAMLAGWRAELDLLIDTYGESSSSALESTVSAQKLADAQAALTAILINQGEGAAEANEQLVELFANFDRGEIGAEELLEDLILIGDSLDDFNRIAAQSGVAASDLSGDMANMSREFSESTIGIDGATESLNALFILLRELDTSMVPGRSPISEFARQMEAAADAANDVNTAIRGGVDDSVSALSDQEAALADSVSDANAAINAQTVGLEGVAALSEDATAALAATKEAFAATGEAWDAAAAEQLAAAQELLATTLEGVASQYTATTAAMENSFRVIVGNTDAIASQSQAVDDWAHQIRILGDDHRNLNTLLDDGLITQTQYGAAVQATMEINRANQSIQENILAIQAQQAPVLAEALAAQDAYVASLATGSAEAQTLALAYMDSATAAQALGLAQSYISDQDTFGPMLESAANLDPFLAAILSDMGLIAQQEDKTWKVIAQPEGMSEVELLTDAVSSLEDTIVSIFVEVDDSELVAMDQMLQESGLPGGGGLVGGGGGGRNIVVTLTAETADADAKIDATTGKLTTWDGATGTGDVLAVNTDAVSKIQLASGNLDTWDASSGNAAIEASDNASGKIASVSGALSALNGKTATTYINTVYTTTYQTVGSPGGMFFGHGGVVDNYATGGVVAEMGEWGPEMLHFPNGGVAMARTPGIYSVPQGTYVDTAPATAAKVQSLSGGINVTINVAGSVGVDDLTEQVTRQLVPALQRAASQHMRSYGL
jgi:hypothetical protein